MSGVVLVTGADLAPQALALLEGFEMVYAGKTPVFDLIHEIQERGWDSKPGRHPGL